MEKGNEIIKVEKGYVKKRSNVTQEKIKSFSAQRKLINFKYYIMGSNQI